MNARIPVVDRPREQAEGKRGEAEAARVAEPGPR